VGAIARGPTTSRTRYSLALIAAGLLACEPNGQSALHPGGPAAERIAELWWLMLAVGTAIFLLVLGVLARIVTHKGNQAEPRTVTDDRVPTRWVLAGGVALPAVILIPLLIFTLRILAGLMPPKDSTAPEVVIAGW
jgi:cytochrome c oxidase subunit II